jgi:hypothetical protein
MSVQPEGARSWRTRSFGQWLTRTGRTTLQLSYPAPSGSSSVGNSQRL